ncbi:MULTISPECIES: D-hexose-6-phosphate mutarotase [unclassified Agarivorans]|uniref:D-hexose-6-phosphate mutarotase n=1 Tax=unclassified Agarivorans TaxID=2636026 RepID=UPI003D7E074E
MILERLNLQVVKQIDNAVFEVMNTAGMLFYWVDHPKVKALISQQGAQLLSFRPNLGQEKLWLSPITKFEPGSAIRGGVPICWPSFGDSNPSLPGHGYARINDWHLEEIDTTEQQCKLIFRLNSRLDPLIDLKCEYVLNQQASIQLTTTNNSEQIFSFNGALHSYFCADVAKLQITGLGDHYFDSVTRQNVTVTEPFSLAPRTDRIYLQPEATTRLDSSYGLVNIHHRGHNSVVVWNPGTELASNMVDIQQYSTQFICIETALTQTTIDLEPKQSHSLEQQIV